MSPVPPCAVALVPAAGTGARLGAGRPKALVDLAGAPLVVHAVRALTDASLIGQVVVAVPAGLEAEFGGLLPGAVIVTGGAHRGDSVRAALAAADPNLDVVLVHDAARCLAPSSLVDAVVAAVLAGADAVVPGLIPADTIKHVDAVGIVIATPARESLRAVQTPQGFRRSVLVRAYDVAAAAGLALTDDAVLVERLGVAVRVVPGAEEAFKVTRPADLLLAAAVLAARALREAAG